MSCELLIGVDNPLFLSGLRDESGYINDAIVTVTIAGIITDEVAEYVEESNGVYKYTLPASAALVDETEYEVEFVAEWEDEEATPRTTTITETYTARADTQSYGPDVYATCDDLYMIFGEDNIRKWADLNNTDDDVIIRKRVNWALHLASRRIDDRLRGGVHITPFQLPYATSLVDMTARLAGVLLYTGPRVIADGDSLADIQPFQDEVNVWLGQVLDGRVRLGRGKGTRGPAVVKQNPWPESDVRYST